MTGDALTFWTPTGSTLFSRSARPGSDGHRHGPTVSATVATASASPTPSATDGPQADAADLDRLAAAVVIVLFRYGHPIIEVDLALDAAPDIEGDGGEVNGDQGHGSPPSTRRLVLAPTLDTPADAVLAALAPFAADPSPNPDAGGTRVRIAAGAGSAGAADAAPAGDGPADGVLAVGADHESLWSRGCRTPLGAVEPAAFLGHVASVLDALPTGSVERPPATAGPTVADIELLTAEEQQALDRWNATGTDLPPLALADAFERQVDRTPDAVAFRDDVRAVTYAELDRQANALADEFHRRGMGAESVVGLVTGRTIDAGTTIVATFKAGAAYAPLDGSQPAARLATALGQVAPDLLVVEARFRAVVDEALDRRGETLPVLALEELVALEPSRQRPVVFRGLDDLAYILTTSGSTGVPKAAMIDQRGLMNHAWAMIDALDLDPTTVVAQNAPLSFDISVWQILTPLLNGGQVCFAPDEARYDPRALFSWLHRQDVTILQIVPSLMATVLAVADEATDLTLPPSLRWLIPTGEALPPDVARRWFARFPAVPLVNAYGPAECSDDVTLHVLEGPPARDETIVPIGHPIANLTVDVVDDAGHRAPVGVVGEIVVGGIGVGRGYRNDPERTDRAFFPDPDHPGRRRYRTGDLARRRPDGALLYEGRVDHQVKLNGRRIELGEIEAALALQPAVDGAVVGLVDGALAAWITTAEQARPLDREALRAALANRLPEFLVPGRVVALDRFPLNPNGKIDRSRLPAPTDADLLRPRTAREEPATPTEVALAAIWRDVIGVDPGRGDDFFDHGGSSLTAAVVLYEVNRRLGADLPLAAPIDNPTLAQLAALIDRARASDRSTAALVELQPRGDRIPLFLAPGQGGSVLGFLPLSRIIDSDQPVFGLDLQRRRSEPSPDQSFAGLVDRYHGALKERFPDGPYVLGGFCMGGDVTLELARRLRREGDEVPLVVMLQSEHPDYPVPRPGIGRLRRLLTTVADRARFEAATTRALPRNQRLRYLTDDLGARSVAKVTVRLERLGARAGLVGTGRRPGSEAFQRDRWYRADGAAYRHHRFEPYDGDVLVVRAARQPAGIVPNPSLGWDAVVRGRLETAEVPGWHWNFLRRPQIDGVAQALSRALDEVNRR